MKMGKRNRNLAGALPLKDITQVGMMVAVIEVCKMALSFLPNIELTSFWLIMFTLLFGWKVFLVIPVFILIEGCIYGFGIWWVMYLYVWPLCSVPYFVIGAADGLRQGLHAGFAWWVSGIPWDIGHCIGNFVLMSVLYRPIRSIMSRLK